MQFGAVASYAFVHPNSLYIGKFFIAFTTLLGYKISEYYQEGYNFSQRFGNFYNYPSEIRRMIDNNDARYAYKWIRDDYTKIPLHTLKTEEWCFERIMNIADSYIIN